MCYDRQTMLSTKKKQGIIKAVQHHEKDTGSSSVQVALLSGQIDKLAEHLKKNRKDHHSRRGLLKMVADRRAHLRFLEKNDAKAYASILKKMDLKK